MDIVTQSKDCVRAIITVIYEKKIVKIDCCTSILYTFLMAKPDFPVYANALYEKNGYIVDVKSSLGLHLIDALLQHQMIVDAQPTSIEIISKARFDYNRLRKENDELLNQLKLIEQSLCCDGK